MEEYDDIDFSLGPRYRSIDHLLILQVNSQRAERYYDKALETNTLETQLQLMVKGLKTTLNLKSYSFLSSLTYGMEYVVKYLWGIV